MNITRRGNAYRLTAEQWLPIAPERLFPFFADATNLERITPDSIRFEVVTPPPIEMREGTRIDYRLKIRGVPTRWRSEIAEWDPPRRFVDVQIRGPYVQWHHEHAFEARDGGTACRDTVDYRVPGGPFAPLIHSMFVKGDVERIFRHRRRKLEALLLGDGAPFGPEAQSSERAEPSNTNASGS